MRSANETAQIEQLRSELHKTVDHVCDGLLALLKGACYAGGDIQGVKLAGNAGYFKGKKPKDVLFPDGRRICVKKWKDVVSTLLSDCISDQGRLERLLGLRGRLFGRQRKILAEDSAGMNQPMQICDQLWMETKYDTETLLNVLMVRVFDVAGYDYSGIRIVIREEEDRNGISG